MLDSLGSTLSRITVKSFFERNGKDPEDPESELTIDEMIGCLEKEVSRPREERRSINLNIGMEEAGVESGVVTPTGSGAGIGLLNGGLGASPRFDKLDFSGPPFPPRPIRNSPYQGNDVNATANVNSNYSGGMVPNSPRTQDQGHLRKPSLPPAYWTEPSQQPVGNVSLSSPR